MEQLILVDSEDREIGSAEKLETHRRGLLHRAFSIFVFDPLGRLLVQRRALSKYHSAGKWSNTCCGHPRPGETTADAAHRRLVEEMRFDCDLRWTAGFSYRAALEHGLIEHEYDHVFLGTWSGAPNPNKSEVCAWDWIAPSALRTALTTHPLDYTAWLGLALPHATA